MSNQGRPRAARAAKKECKIVTKELSCLLNSVSTGRPAVSAQYGRSCERGEA